MWRYLRAHLVANAARLSIHGSANLQVRGAIVISPLPGVTATKPGSATTALPGFTADLLDFHKGKRIEIGGGLLALTKPWPSMLRTIWGDDDARIRRDVFHKMERPPRSVLSRRWCETRRGRLLLDPRPRRRRAERRGPSYRDYGSRERARGAPGRRGSGSRRQGDLRSRVRRLRRSSPYAKA